MKTVIRSERPHLAFSDVFVWNVVGVCVEVFSTEQLVLCGYNTRTHVSNLLLGQPDNIMVHVYY